MEMNVSVTLKIVTCRCGVVYAVPHWVEKYRCPMCADREIVRCQQEVKDLHDLNLNLHRTISALKGALTRKRRAR
jgi:predicted RNA-binding Zn-ribbon protein involved in translation (DUF1610 family)